MINLKQIKNQIKSTNIIGRTIKTLTQKHKRLNITNTQKHNKPKFINLKNIYKLLNNQQNQQNNN
jgi:hypothetical protein